MKNTGAIVAYLFVVIVIIFFMRLILIRTRVVGYIKKYHRDYWGHNILPFLTGGRASIPHITRGLTDPKIEEFKKEDIRALKQLLLAIVFMFLVLLVLAILRVI